MWRGVARNVHLLPSRFSIYNPNLASIPRFTYDSITSSSSFSSSAISGHGLLKLRACIPSLSRIHSASVAWKLGHGRLFMVRLFMGRRLSDASVVSSADSSPESAAMLGSSRLAPAFLFQKGSEISEIFNHYGRCYWVLSKARLSMLVVATSGAGYVLGSGHVINFTGLCCTCLGTMMVAASANTLNQVFEVQNDAKMKRTRQRPLPSGHITAPHAVMFASSMGFAGISFLAWKANYLASGLAALNLFLYAFVYTPLKKIHPANTWVGAVVGAIPPLLGWAAASGEVSLNALLLPAALYFWQIPHFMALAYLCRNDYLAGGFKMLSFADSSGWRTAWVSLRNSLYLLPFGYVAYDWGITSKWFALESSLMTLFLSGSASLFVLQRTAKSARKMFHASLIYLPLFMSAMLFHRLPGTAHVEARIQDLSEDGALLTRENDECESGCGAPARAPVAYASIAPFPFLPAPIYIPTSF